LKDGRKETGSPRAIVRGLLGQIKFLPMLVEIRAVWEYGEALAKLVLTNLRTRYEYLFLSFCWLLLIGGSK